MKDLNKRFWEIDVLRGLAILMMVTYHLIFDLSYFGVFPFNISSGIWWWFARLTAFIFLFLVGISLTLSYTRAELTEQKHEKKSLQEKKSLFPKYLKRGAKIFFLGLLITLTTWIFIPEDFIVFGVLHFIGIAIILEYPFLNKKYLNLVLGIIFIIAGFILAQFTVNYPWFLWLGLKPAAFITVDYFPLLPWLGVVSLGLFAGKTLYPDYERRFHLINLSQNLFTRMFSFLGQHSLLIYLLHQPLLIMILYFTGVLDLGNLLHFINV
ncbi:MAG: putative membrane protein [Methanobacterium sp. Maddingley MBC34]|nr:MAG: putative membrane protein [Methanobacterium sp. Maddingley MBC34]